MYFEGRQKKFIEDLSTRRPPIYVMGVISDNPANHLPPICEALLSCVC